MGGPIDPPKKKSQLTDEQVDLVLLASCNKDVLDAVKGVEPKKPEPEEKPKKTASRRRS